MVQFRVLVNKALLAFDGKSHEGDSKLMLEKKFNKKQTERNSLNTNAEKNYRTTKFVIVRIF